MIVTGRSLVDNYPPVSSAKYVEIHFIVLSQKTEVVEVIGGGVADTDDSLHNGGFRRTGTGV